MVHLDNQITASCSVSFSLIESLGKQHLCVIEAVTFNLDFYSIGMAEVTFLLKGIKYALSRGIRHLIIEGDNLLVVNYFQGKWKILWQIDHLIKDILQHFDKWEIHHVYKEANELADWIVSVGHLVESTMVITN